MFCANCGNKLNENADVCTSCGKVIDKSAVVKPEEKYCPNCGKKVDINADICLGCGVMLNKKPVANGVVANPNKASGKAVASLVLGIIGAFIVLCTLIGLGDLGVSSYYYSSAYMFGYAFGYCLIPMIFGIMSFIFSLVDRKNNKNGMNTAGFILALIIFGVCLIQFIAILGM